MPSVPAHSTEATSRLLSAMHEIHAPAPRDDRDAPPGNAVWHAAPATTGCDIDLQKPSDAGDASPVNQKRHAAAANTACNDDQAMECRKALQLHPEPTLLTITGDPRCSRNGKKSQIPNVKITTSGIEQWTHDYDDGNCRCSDRKNHSRFRALETRFRLKPT